MNISLFFFSLLFLSKNLLFKLWRHEQQGSPAFFIDQRTFFIKILFSLVAVDAVYLLVKLFFLSPLPNFICLLYPIIVFICVYGFKESAARYQSATSNLLHIMKGKHIPLSLVVVY